MNPIVPSCFASAIFIEPIYTAIGLLYLTAYLNIRKQNAHDFVRQFQDKKRETIISLLVLDKYFRLSGQIK